MPKKYTEEKIIEVLNDAIKNDLTAREIEKKHDLYSSVVYSWAYKAGVALKETRNIGYNWNLIRKSIRKEV